MLGRAVSSQSEGQELQPLLQSLCNPHDNDRVSASPYDPKPSALNPKASTKVPDGH